MNRDEIQRLLGVAAAAQVAYWDAVRELEAAADVELDGEDLGGCDVDGILALREEEK